MTQKQWGFIRNKELHILLVLLTSVPLGLFAQTAAQTPTVDSLTASKNLVSMPPPVYPMHAKQLHIQGTVAVELAVDASGRVTSVHILSGPTELQQGAIDAFSKAKYRPFLNNGKPVPAKVMAKINFEMNDAPLKTEDQVVAREYFELHEKCEALIKKHSSEAMVVCLKTIEVSKKFSPDAELESRAVAYDDTAKLLFEAGKIEEAGALGNEVVTLVGPAGRISQATATAYTTRAQTRLGTGDVAGGIADIDDAVDILKQLKSKETSPVFTKMFAREIEEALRAKSDVLRQLGRNAEANEVDKEAAKE
jgi:TonB family protein